MRVVSLQLRLALLLAVAAAGCGRLRFEDLRAESDSRPRDAGAGAVDDPDAEAGFDPQQDAGPVCEVTGPELCNRLDDDCNGLVDDVDSEGDGVRDCSRTLFLGDEGERPTTQLSAWLSSRVARVERAHRTAGEPLSPALLADVDLVIVDQLMREYSFDEADTLRRWVEQGGSLLALNGYFDNTPVARANGLLMFFGIAYVGGARTGSVTAFESHPLSEGLSMLAFRGGFALQLAGEPAQTTLIASLPSRLGPDQTPEAVGYAQERGQGRIFVWGDDWVAYDETWNASPMARQFWLNAIDWLTATR